MLQHHAVVLPTAVVVASPSPSKVANMTITISCGKMKFIIYSIEGGRKNGNEKESWGSKI